MYGAESNYSSFLARCTVFLKLTRGIRNCLDHRLSQTVVRDFELQANANILKPTIEVNYRESKLERMDLQQFFASATENILSVFEIVLANLCSKNLTNSISKATVEYIPVERRRYKLVKYGYKLQMIGDYYEQ